MLRILSLHRLSHENDLIEVKNCACTLQRQNKIRLKVTADIDRSCIFSISINIVRNLQRAAKTPVKGLSHKNLLVIDSSY